MNNLHEGISPTMISKYMGSLIKFRFIFNRTGLDAKKSMKISIVPPQRGQRDIFSFVGLAPQSAWKNQFCGSPPLKFVLSP